jgi:hypothetical protein
MKTDILWTWAKRKNTHEFAYADTDTMMPVSETTASTTPQSQRKKENNQWQKHKQGESWYQKQDTTYKTIIKQNW